MSSAERFALAGALALLLVQALAATITAVAPTLEYQRAALAAAPWRVVTGHWVHINTPHVVINAAAWFVVARLFATELAPARQMVVIVVASVAIGVGLAWRYPAIGWYRGFSGVLHALYFSGAATWLACTLRQRSGRSLAMLWLPAALLVGGWVKVILEQPDGSATPVAAWLGAPTVPQAHLIGALCGTALGVVFAIARWPRSAVPTRAGYQSE